MTAIADEITSKEPPATAAAVSGVVDLGDGRGFLRTAGYRRSPGDIPISTAQVRQYGLRPGDHIEGTAGRRQGKPALLGVDSVNGFPAAEAGRRPEFDRLTPVYPTSGSVSKTATRRPPRGSSTWSRRSARASAASSWPRPRRARPPC